MRTPHLHRCTPLSGSGARSTDHGMHRPRPPTAETGVRLAGKTGPRHAPSGLPRSLDRPEPPGLLRLDVDPALLSPRRKRFDDAFQGHAVDDHTPTTSGGGDLQPFERVTDLVQRVEPAVACCEASAMNAFVGMSRASTRKAPAAPPYGCSLSFRRPTGDL